MLFCSNYLISQKIKKFIIFDQYIAVLFEKLFSLQENHTRIV